MKVIEYAIIATIIFPPLCFGFCFDEAGREYAISPFLLETLARVESNMNPRAMHRNNNGSFDVGLMQINSSWMSRLDKKTDELLSDPCANVMVGAWILRQCLDAHGYTWQAIGCYNARSSAKRMNYAWKVFQGLKKDHPSTAMAENNKTADSTLIFRLHGSDDHREEKGR